MKNRWLLGTTLLFSSTLGCAYADWDNSDAEGESKVLAQQAAGEVDANPNTSAAPQTIKIGDEEYSLIPAASIEPDSRRLDLYFSDKVGNFQYERSASVINVENGRINAGFLFSEERDTVFSSSVMLDSDKGLLPGVRLSFGSRGYVALLGIENVDVFGLSLGAEVEFIVPLEKLPLRLTAGYFYSPDILSFGDADRIFDWNVNVGLQLREFVMIYAGVRYLQMDTSLDKREVDDRLHVGVRWTMD